MTITLAAFATILGLAYCTRSGKRIKRRRRMSRALRVGLERLMHEEQARCPWCRGIGL